ncbi:Intradiol ring-cleavage dioxygenase [Cladorrhinum samala]|uniref:Intradiol ring-cleavage dioxygenase n=1 Tax=Cladorrhinum samala TaxID=585594 RepID=A0AAV9HE20_9PEZI|nr:Intradiol ring-cleavage dioxygenase [Cladorrhinum samala]
MHFTKATTAGLALLSGIVSAHPGHDVAHEAAERREYLASVKRSSLAHCADKLQARGISSRNVARRQARIEHARQKRSIKRSIDDALATNHNKTSLGFTPETDAATLFAGNNSCILAPDVTQGPYYVSGEFVRENLVEDQEGVSLLLDYQVIDVNTCDPVPNLYLEIWNCNATGVYGGVVANGNGDSSDASNIDNTFLRGIQPTNEDGVATFETIFPGHYSGRTTHIHLMAHANATLLANQTLGNDIYSSHVGQVFFDQDLIYAVEKAAPYNTNTQTLLLNSEDNIMSEEFATDGVDFIMEYAMLGDKIEDGVFAWLAFGVDTTASNKVSPAVFLYEGGGVANPDSNMGGGPGGGPGGPPPSGTGGGFFPSGTAGVPPSGSAVPPPSTDVPAVSTEVSASSTAADTSSAAPTAAASGGGSCRAGVRPPQGQQQGQQQGQRQGQQATPQQQAGQRP